MTVSFINLLAFTAIACSFANIEHDHWEYAAIYDTSTGDLSHSLLIERPFDGSELFKLDLLIVPASSGDEDGLEMAEVLAEQLKETQTPIEIRAAHFWVEKEILYEISLHNESWITAVSFNLANAAYYAIFLSHHMDELCSSHCIRDSNGFHLEPLFVETGQSVHHDPKKSVDWESTIGGALVVWTAVFAGILLLACGVKRYNEITESNVHFLNMFASGALLSTAFCLILLEASHFISSSDLSESAVSGVWGSMIMIGFLTASIIDMLREAVLFVMKRTNTQAVDQFPSVPEAINTTAITPKDNEVELSNFSHSPNKAVIIEDTARQQEGIVISILVGDFLHNFCDGVFIGAAFQSCSTTLAWTIVATTSCHEIAQEIADFVILTKKAGLSIPAALMVNAMSGFSVLLGSIVVSVTSLSDLSIGILLVFGSGNYIYLAAAELFPSVHSHGSHQSKESSGVFGSSAAGKLFGLLMFALGACAVGLVLLNHEHCESKDTASSSSAHNH